MRARFEFADNAMSLFVDGLQQFVEVGQAVPHVHADAAR
jgi:hypothetical protein